MISPGKLIVLIGIMVVLAGLATMFLERFPWFGRLPGDMTFKGKNHSFYIPITTSIILSVVLTVILNVIFRRR
jgi:hypothetical protein